MTTDVMTCRYCEKPATRSFQILSALGPAERQPRQIAGSAATESGHEMSQDDAKLAWQAQRMDIMDPGWRDRFPEIGALVERIECTCETTERDGDERLD